MIPIKILCECGQKYAFDVEPIGGRIHQAVQCPACGTDGTTTTNQLIAQHLADNPAPASGLRIAGPQRPATVPPPPRHRAAAAQAERKKGNNGDIVFAVTTPARADR
jgi:hypothetical protein